MGDHPTVDDLADAAEGLLDPVRDAQVQAHLGGCARCRESAATLRRVTEVLAAEPTPRMPDAVAARLQARLAQESASRAAAAPAPAPATVTPLRPVSSHGAHTASSPRHATLGHFGHDLPHRSGWRRSVPLLAAAAAALVVGSGGYVLSATAGLNEPPVATVAVSTQDLADQARSLEQDRDLDPHRFSNAWFCARQTTRGRITGLVGARVDGSPALLVYTRSTGSSVTVVTGCDGLQPAAIASAVLSR